MKKFNAIEPKTWKDNLFHMVDGKWMLICTEDRERKRLDLMTASWADLESCGIRRFAFSLSGLKDIRIN